MTLSLGRALSTVALTAGLTLATAGTAAAETYAALDAHGDVLAYDASGDPEAAGTPAPGVKNGDVWRTVFKHADRRVSVRIKFADLRRKGVMSGFVVRVATNEKVRRDVVVFAGPKQWRGQAQMMRPNGNPVDCAVKHNINYDTNVVTMSFPRTCVSEPRWVRMGAGSFWMDGASNTAYQDDAQLSGRVNQTTVKLSPRIRRG